MKVFSTLGDMLKSNYMDSLPDPAGEPLIVGEWKIQQHAWSQWQVYHLHEEKFSNCDPEMKWETCWLNTHGEWICPACHYNEIKQPPEQLLMLLKLQQLKHKPQDNLIHADSTFYISSSAFQFPIRTKVI